MSTSNSPGSIVLISRLSRVVYKRANEEALGMRLKEFATLSNLTLNGAMPQQELCVAMHLDPNNCVLLLNDLEAAGRIQRRRDPADRRRHIVEITAEGRVALEAAEGAMEGLEGEVLGALSPDEREVLRGLLARALADERVEQPA